MSNSTHLPLPARTSVAQFVTDVSGAALGVLLLWSRRQRDRRLLASLDDHLLRDVGLTRDQVQQETLKRFWIR